MASRHLLNPLAPLNQPTPSELDGVPPPLERDLRAYGAILIQQAGVMLKAPQVVMATAQVLFQRFWFVTSLKHFGIKDIGLASLFLASKLEESPVRMRDLINSYAYLLALSEYAAAPGHPPPSAFAAFDPGDFFAAAFYDTKDALVIAEMQILKRLGFQTQVGLPYGHLINYLQVLELTANVEVVRTAWGYVNDLLQTPAPALYPQSTLALASVYLATRLASPPVPLPLTPVPWWTLFDASEDDLVAVCEPLLCLYKDWGMAPAGATSGTSPSGADQFGTSHGAGADGNGNGNGNESGGSSAREYDPRQCVHMNVWRRGGALPIDKAGVRRLIPDGAGKGSGNGGGAGRTPK